MHSFILFLFGFCALFHLLSPSGAYANQPNALTIVQLDGTSVISLHNRQGFIGAGFNIVFQQCLNFPVDTCGPYGASAISANTFLHSLVAFGVLLAAGPIFLKMGVGPALSLLGGTSCLALPVLFIFMKYCLKLRKMSKFALVVED
jgi:hypothetical protein